MQYLLGAIILTAGVGFVVKTEWVLENFGTSAWAEAHLGSSGGSRLMYKGLGLILIFFGFLLVTNLFGAFLFATLGSLFNR